MKAWELIDAAGCRGLTRGGAQVSEKHCNFLINTGTRDGRRYRRARARKCAAACTPRPASRWNGRSSASVCRRASRRAWHDPRRGPLRRHLRRARGQPRHRPAGDRRAARGRLRRDADRGRRRPRRCDRRARRRGPTPCSTRCTAASARTARSRACSTGWAFPTRIPACAPRRSRWTRWRPRRCSPPPACRSRTAASCRSTSSRPPIRCRCPTWSSRSTKAPRSASKSSAAATTAAPRSRAAWRFGSAALVEEYIPGRELTVGVMGDRALAVTEILAEAGASTTTSSNTPTAARATSFRPRCIPTSTRARWTWRSPRIARSAAAARPRCDFRYDDTAGEPGRLVLLEINTQPGLTPTSLLPEQAAHHGIEFPAALRLDGGERRHAARRPVGPRNSRQRPARRALEAAAAPAAAAAASGRLVAVALLAAACCSALASVRVAAGTRRHARHAARAARQRDRRRPACASESSSRAAPTRRNPAARGTRRQQGRPDPRFSLEQARAAHRDAVLGASTPRWSAGCPAPSSCSSRSAGRSPSGRTRASSLLIDRDGQVVADRGRRRSSANLPLVVGPGAPARRRRAAGRADRRPALQKRVVAAVRVGERRWNLRLNNGADVMLPEGHEVAALDRLMQLAAGPCAARSAAGGDRHASAGPPRAAPADPTPTPRRADRPPKKPTE